VARAALVFAAFFMSSPGLAASAASDAGAATDEGLPALAVTASCEPLAGPGKVRCAVHVRPEGGAWRWGDVIVVAAPGFAPPLRTRAGLADLVRKDESEVEFALALAAVADGSGTLRIRARAVVCGARGCRPVFAEAEARVIVGGASP
jgi:hypothetical protein